MDLLQLKELLGVSPGMLALGAFVVMGWTAVAKKEFKASGRVCYLSNLIPATAMAWFAAGNIKQGVILTIIWTIGSSMIWQLAKDGLAKLKPGGV